MNANAKKWVEALRSGEFKQTHRRLRKDNGYCCLGVGCELYQRETGDGKWYNDPENDYDTFVTTDGEIEASQLPSKVMDWLGLRDEVGRYGYHQGAVSCLADDNDEGATFEQIAAIIESEPAELFKEGVK